MSYNPCFAALDFHGWTFGTAMCLLFLYRFISEASCFSLPNLSGYRWTSRSLAMVPVILELVGALCSLVSLEPRTSPHGVSWAGLVDSIKRIWKYPPIVWPKEWLSVPCSRGLLVCSLVFRFTSAVIPSWP